jgi:hypothetical protein
VLLANSRKPILKVIACLAALMALIEVAKARKSELRFLTLGPLGGDLG